MFSTFRFRVFCEPMKHLWAILACLLIFLNTYAQNISGNWFGVGKVEGSTSGNGYLTELVINQKGKNITGDLSYYFRDSLFTYKITGSFDAATRILKINGTNFIFHKSTNTTTGIDCPMKGVFLIRIAKAESVITGSFMADNDYRFTCPPINFKLKKQTETEEEKQTEVVKDNIEPEKKKDTVVVAKNEPVVEETKDTATIAAKKKKEEEFEKRGKTYIKEIVVTNNELNLEFYDNGAIDYDSISVFLNNKLVLPKSKLDHKALRVTIKLDDKLPFNELSMFAESLGFIPPNTAALIIHDGDKRYDVLMTSDFNITSTIKLIKQQ